MPESLSTALLLELLPTLFTAFPRTLGKDNVRQTAEVYRTGLRGLSGDAVRAAVDRVIREDSYFPKVARLREIAHEWEKRNVAIVAPAATDPLWCPSCRTKASWLSRWRPVVDKRFQPLCTTDGAYLLLEPYHRQLCACAPACPYVPIVGVEPPAMRAADAPPIARRRAQLVVDPALIRRTA